MIFVLDVGNTNTVLGVFDQGELKYEWRMKTDKYKTEDEFGMFIRSLLDHEGLSFENINDVIISSVVPPILFALERMSKKYFQLDPMIIGAANVKDFLKITYPNPKELGADRVVNAVGAIEEYGAPLIIVDFGTATTYCYINGDESYVGGLITPGINISLDALYRNAAKLPKIELKRTENMFGQSTIEAMQSGVYYGYVGQVEEIVNRMKKDVEENPTVIATGGLANLIAKDATSIDKVDQHLTLKGLYYIYKKNK